MGDPCRSLGWTDCTGGTCRGRVEAGRAARDRANRASAAAAAEVLKVDTVLRGRNLASKGVEGHAMMRRRAFNNASKSVQERVEECGGVWRGVQ